MHSLIVFAHPQSASLTGSIAAALASRLGTDGDTAEVADLAAEGFDPRITAHDLEVMRGTAAATDDVRREQLRVEAADALVLLYPVYWWGLPGLLKGWIDRVLTSGWAYGDGSGALSRPSIHVAALAGTDAATYARHGYTESMRVIIEHGIFEYCGTSVASSHVLYNTEEGTIAAKLGDDRAQLITSVAAAVRSAPTASR